PVPQMPRADWGKACVDELIQDLGHPNLVVRMKATNQLVERDGEEAISNIKKMLGVTRVLANAARIQGLDATRVLANAATIHGLWVLERSKSLDDHALEPAAKNSDRGVRVHAMRILAE